MNVRKALLLAVLAGFTPNMAQAQERAWAADFSVGYAAFVDDAAKNYWLAGGSLRKYVTPRISIGPELVFTANEDLVRDRNVLLTGNVMLDAAQAGSRVIPFVVGGVGIFRGRDQVPNGPFWFTDPAFTAGGGFRARVNDTWSAAAEYRIAWELHHRVSGSVGVQW